MMLDLWNMELIREASARPNISWHIRSNGYLLIPFNMFAFEDTLAEAVVSPYMWMETVILAGILIYLNR